MYSASLWLTSGWQIYCKHYMHNIYTYLFRYHIVMITGNLAIIDTVLNTAAVSVRVRHTCACDLSYYCFRQPFFGCITIEIFSKVLSLNWCHVVVLYLCPDSKVHWANMGPIWGQQDPGGPHVGPMNFAIWVCSMGTGNEKSLYLTKLCFLQNQWNVYCAQNEMSVMSLIMQNIQFSSNGFTTF